MLGSASNDDCPASTNNAVLISRVLPYLNAARDGFWGLLLWCCCRFELWLMTGCLCRGGGGECFLKRCWSRTA